MDHFWYSLAEALALPPGAIAAAGACGAVLLLRYRRLGLVIFCGLAPAIWVMSMPVTAAWLARPLENVPVIDIGSIGPDEFSAIVVLGGGRYHYAPEYGGRHEVSHTTLQRLLYGARLHKATGLDVAVTGGGVADHGPPEGVLMRRLLETDFAVPVRWVERTSRNTYENATKCRELLPFDDILLVTHAMHMQRALAVFEHVGFNPTPAPMGFETRAGVVYEPGLFLPTIGGLYSTWYALHEYLGRAWYRVRYL